MELSDLKEYPLMLKAKQVAEILQVSRKTIDNYVREGFINSVQMESGYRVEKKDLVKFINNRKAWK